MEVWLPEMMQQIPKVPDLAVVLRLGLLGKEATSRQAYFLWRSWVRKVKYNISGFDFDFAERQNTKI